MKSLSIIFAMDQRELDLLQAVVSEVTKTARLYPHKGTNELALLILHHPNWSKMTTIQAISSLASRASSSNEVIPPATTMSNASFRATEISTGPIAFPSAIEGWDLIKRSGAYTMPTATDKKCLDANPTMDSKLTAKDGPTENDIIVTDCSIKVPKEPGHVVPSQEDQDVSRAKIHQCVILGTLVCMLVEMEQL